MLWQGLGTQQIALVVQQMALLSPGMPAFTEEVSELVRHWRVTFVRAFDPVGSVRNPNGVEVGCGRSLGFAYARGSTKRPGNCGVPIKSTNEESRRAFSLARQS